MDQSDEANPESLVLFKLQMVPTRSLTLDHNQQYEFITCVTCIPNLLSIYEYHMSYVDTLDTLHYITLHYITLHYITYLYILSTLYTNRRTNKQTNKQTNNAHIFLHNYAHMQYRLVNARCFNSYEKCLNKGPSTNLTMTAKKTTEPVLTNACLVTLSKSIYTI